MLPVQCRLARVAVGWTVLQLATAAAVTAGKVSKFELGRSVGPTTIAAIQRALEAEGVVFIAAGESSIGGGPGIRLRGALS